MIVGVDVGTQSLKAVVADSALKLRGRAAEAYKPSFPQPGWAEQHPGLWERALGPAIAAALAQAGVGPGQIEALGICGQLDGCVPVNDKGQAAGNCLIWIDRRAEAQTASIPAGTVRATGGLVLDASHMAAKIRWLKQQGDPSICRFHQPVSYLVERLTGRAVMDHALASTSMVYSLKDRRYDPALLGLFGIEEHELPPLAEAADAAGSLTSQGAALTGLPAGIPVAVGTGDDFSTTLGAGVVDPGPVVVVLGTGEVVGAIHPQPTIDQESLVETHAYPGGAYLIENPGWLCGGALVWLKELLGTASFAALDELAAEAPPGADGLLFLPALTGAMAPEWVPAARGCFYGLTPSHGRAHWARAVLEGCAFAMRDVTDRLAQMGLRTDSLLLLGGGARSRIWGQIRADLTGLPVQVPPEIDGSPVGAAMLAAVAAGRIADLRQAAALVSGARQTLQPVPGHKAVYDDAYDRYRRLFAALKPLYEPALPAR
ncbi:xylulokinase [Hypericibacter sp.]|uniref:xylulokinase n=1 Tax=Hypericibacter sp. TaxID=2705401 RepID=UPI003D6D0C9F